MYYSLELYCRMFINKWDRLAARPKINKNGSIINKWCKGKLFFIRVIGWGSQRLTYSIEKGGEIFQKLVSMYPTFCFTIVVIFSRYPNLLPFQDPSELGSLASEFHNYQVLCDEDILQNVWKEAKNNSGNIQIDRIWCFLSEMKNVDGSYRVEKLSKILKLILTVPYSNSE